jgi:hypothetical protein
MYIWTETIRLFNRTLPRRQVYIHYSKNISRTPSKWYNSKSCLLFFLFLQTRPYLSMFSWPCKQHFLPFSSKHSSVCSNGGQIANIQICELIICQICGSSVNVTCDLRTQSVLWFADLKRLRVRKNILFLVTNIAYNALIKICTY